MSSALVPFARPISLSGKGPFRLPRMKAVVSFGDGPWEWPIIRFQTVEGEEVIVPFAAEAVNALKIDIQAWLRQPGNPVGT